MAVQNPDLEESWLKDRVENEDQRQRHERPEQSAFTNAFEQRFFFHSVPAMVCMMV